MQVTPLPTARAAHALLGVVALAFGAALWIHGSPQPPGRAVAVVLGGFGAVVIVRSFRLGVDCRDGTVRVRGLLRTRDVLRTQIAEVTGFPALRWQDRSGRNRWTPLVFLASGPRTLAAVRAHNERELGRLRRWVRSGNDQRPEP